MLYAENLPMYMSATRLFDLVQVCMACFNAYAMHRFAIPKWRALVARPQDTALPRQCSATKLQQLLDMLCVLVAWSYLNYRIQEQLGAQLPQVCGFACRSPPLAA